jgi:hypothetical protein
MGTSRSVAVQVAKDTILRRYAPDSVKFDDAKPEPAAQFAQLKAGRPVARARNPHPDGSD